MLRDTILQTGFSSFLASLLFWVEPPLEKPDIRHWSDSLQEAAPQFADFEAFMSEAPIDVSLEELKEASTQRRGRLLKLDEAMDGELSQGQGFRFQRERVSLLQEEMSYRRFQKQYDVYTKSSHWRALDMDRAKLNEKDHELSDLALKTLNVSRDLAKAYPFEEDVSASLLIRAMVRVQHSNTNLFFEQFKKKFPASPQAPLVYHAMAELAAEQKRWAEAEQLLKQALENKEYRERPYSVFRLAWVHLQRSFGESEQSKREEAYDKAVLGFRLSLKLLQEKPQETGLFPLEDQLLIDLAWVFAIQKKPSDEVLAFFEKEEAPLAHQDYLYFSAIEADRRADYAEADRLWKSLSDLSLLSLDRPRVLLSQAEHARLKGDQEAMLQRYKDVRSLLDPETPWGEAFEDRKEEWERIRSMTAHHLSFAAQMAYLEGESTPEPPPAGKRSRAEALAASESLYKLYEEWYPEGSAREEGKYYKALSLYFKGLYQESLKILTLMAGEEKNPMRRDAAYNAVLVAAAFDEKQKLPKLPALGQARKPVPLTPSKQTLVERTETFLSLYPDAPEKAPFQYMLAQLYFEFGHYLEAIPRYTAVILNFPATEQGETALHTLLQYYVETAQWDVLIPLCEDWMKNKALRAAGHRKILRQTLEYAQSQKAAGGVSPG